MIWMSEQISRFLSLPESVPKRIITLFGNIYVEEI